MENCTECKMDPAGNHEPYCPFMLEQELLHGPNWKIISDQEKYYARLGWLCPKCGRGNAPSTASCPCVPAPVLALRNSNEP